MNTPQSFLNAKRKAFWIDIVNFVFCLRCKPNYRFPMLTFSKKLKLFFQQNVNYAKMDRALL